MSYSYEIYDLLFILAKELAENSHVQDAFVIAVEQQAKERLERLSALRKIKPVDMSTLSQQVKLNENCTSLALPVLFRWLIANLKQHIVYL